MHHEQQPGDPPQPNTPDIQQAAVPRGIREHGPAFTAWADTTENENLPDGFSEAFLGQFESAHHYAEQLVADLGYENLLKTHMPDQLRPYVRIDTASLALDLEFNGDINTVPAGESGRVWIFAKQNTR